MSLSIDFLQYCGWDDRTINIIPFIYDNEILIEKIINKINTSRYSQLERVLKKTFIEYGHESAVGDRYLIYELCGYEYHMVIGPGSLKKEFIKK